MSKNNDMLELSLRETKSLIELYTVAQIPLMMWGLMGVGKSAIVKAVAQEQNRPLVDVRLSTLDPSEFSGIPYYDQCEKVLKRAVSDLFPMEGGGKENAILLLDEISDAPPSMQSAAYRLILDRELGNGVKIPEGVSILAAGNTAAAHGGGGNMLSPLANRMGHVEVITNPTEFLEDYAYENFHPLVASFIKTDHGALHNYTGKSQKAFATNRSWERVSDLCKDLESKFGSNFYANKLFISAVASQVGSGMAAKFNSHSMLDGQLPAMQDILEGKAKPLSKDLTAQMGVMYILTTNVLGASLRLGSAKEDGWEEQVSNALQYLEENTSGDEMPLIVLQTIFRNQSDAGKAVKVLPKFKELLTTERTQLIIDASMV